MKIKEQLAIGLCGLAIFAGMATANAQVVVRIGPPAPVIERPGPPPRAGYVWVGGYHRWDGGRYVWTPGRWAMPPRPHAVWVPGRWDHRGGGYVWVEGRWR
jgi:hypothetical protein